MNDEYFDKQEKSVEKNIVEEKVEKEKEEEEKIIEEKIENKIVKNSSGIFKSIKKVICFQLLFLVICIIVITHILNIFNIKIYDFINYFIFGTFISVYIVATIILIYFYKKTSSMEFFNKYGQWYIKLINKYLPGISNKNYFNIILFIISIIVHLLFPIIIYFYVKYNINNYIKTNYALIKSLILHIIYVYILNLYYINMFRTYNKSFDMTKKDFNIAIFSITFLYIGLIYYFESIKQ